MTAKIMENPICCSRPELQMFTRLDIGAAAGSVLSLARTDGENREVPGLLVTDGKCLEHNQDLLMFLIGSRHLAPPRYGRS